jgi:hypothetical protein
MKSLPSCGPRVAVAVALLAAAAALVAPAWAQGARVTTLHVGDTLTVSGRTGSARGHVRRAVGLVVVEGRWNGGPRYVVTTTRTNAAGRYHFVVRPHRSGWLVLRIVPPDKRPQRFVVHVLARAG